MSRRRYSIFQILGAGDEAMQYEFLKDFPRRMKHVGLYVALAQNSLQKASWKKYGFQKADEQFNVVFAVLLYIMEQSLKEEHCTIDDIGTYLDDINTQYLEKEMSYEDCRGLGDFIVNTVLSNEGKAMYFDGFHFGKKEYQAMNVSYVANRIVYNEQEVRRTSYYLTDDGYALLLSTLEIEDNMKLTIHEMVFQMHLEKQSYDKAADEIKNVFSLLRIQLQKIREAMGKIRRNALDYSVRDYEEILQGNLETIGDTKKKFQDYRKLVRDRAKELEEANINVRKLTEREEEKLGYLHEIEQYLSRSIDEHQKILSSHFDLKSLYTKELEALSQMSLIRRFPFRAGFYDKVLEQPQALASLEYFLRPLFGREPEKSYNLNKAFQLQRPSRRRAEEDGGETLDFDGEAWEREQEELRARKLRRYEDSLACLLGYAAPKGEITLAELARQTEGSEGVREVLLPDVQVFKEIIVELIRHKEIDVWALRKEQSEYIGEPAKEFQLGPMLLYLTEEYPEFRDVWRVGAYRLEGGEKACFADVPDGDGGRKAVYCSNVRIFVEMGGESHGV